MGIALNSRMPQPLRKWGCDRLYLTFGNALPPKGCESEADPQPWIEVQPVPFEGPALWMETFRHQVRSSRSSPWKW